MHSPPHSEIIEALNGQTIETISFGRYVFHLLFESGDRVSVACPFRFGAEKTIEKSPALEAPLNNSDLLRLIGLSATHAGCEADGTLHLKFQNDDTLIAYANNPQYEAYTLLIGGKEYVV